MVGRKQRAGIREEKEGGGGGGAVEGVEKGRDGGEGVRKEGLSGRARPPPLRHVSHWGEAPQAHWGECRDYSR